LVAFLAASPAFGIRGSRDGSPEERIRPAIAHLSLTHTESGRTIDVTHVWSASGHSAVIRYTDPEAGALAFFIDRSGAISSDFGFRLSSPIHSAVWQGRAVPASGVTTISYEADGRKGEATVPYTTDPDLAGAPPIADSSAVAGKRLSSFRAFVAEVSAAAAKPGGFATISDSGFEMAVAGTLPGVAEGAAEGAKRPQDWIQFGACAFGVTATTAAGAAVIAACIVTAGAGCMLAIFLYVGGGFFAARDCAAAFNYGR